MLGGDAVGVSFKDWAFEQWREKYGTKPPWGKVEYISLATALERLDTEDEARAAWDAYLACDEPFYQGHAPRLFLRDLGKWVGRYKRPKPVEQEDPVRARMLKILLEVERDPSIPEDKKRLEAAKRWKGIQA